MKISADQPLSLAVLRFCGKTDTYREEKKLTEVIRVAEKIYR